MQTQEKTDYLALHLARVPVHRALIRALEHRLFSQEKLERPILDIGCGDGHYAAIAFQDGIDVGIDITREIVVEAAHHGAYRHLDIADGTRLPYANESFRTVVSNCVIEHIWDVETLISEVARVLRVGGRFLFSVPNHRFTDSLFVVGTLKRFGLEGLAKSYGSWWNKHAMHYHLDEPAVWQDRLARHGLTVERQMDYMSSVATKVFELSHYYALPSVIWHELTGHWSLFPNKVRKSVAYRWLHPYATEDWPVAGSCSFFVARK